MNDLLARFGVLWREPGLSRSKPSWEPPGNIHRAKFSPKGIIMKKTQKYVGIKPNGENFTLASNFFDAHSKSEWIIYEDGLTSSKWWQYKIISCQPVPRKANYSIAFDPKAMRLTGKDLPIMAKHSPSLLDMFLKKTDIKPKFFGPSCSESIEDLIRTAH